VYITQTLKRALQINRHGIATIDGTRQHTWAQGAERVAKLAGVFQGLGLRAEGRVAILALNSDRYFECFFAVPWAGGIVVPLNIRLTPAELIYMLNDSGTEILVVDDAFQTNLPALTPRQGVSIYQKRWAIELVNWELKSGLGLGQHQVSGDEKRSMNSVGIAVLAYLFLLRAGHHEITPGQSWRIFQLQPTLQLRAMTNQVEHHIKVKLARGRKAA